MSPRAVGRYAILGEIAAGGMASVHLGRFQAPGGFSRVVAVKRLHPQFAHDPDFVAMFLDEARVASRIRHPNVVSTLDVVAEAGELFLVMEFVQGEPLSKLLRGSASVSLAVPIPVALSIAVGMLEGLHAAHEARGEHGEALTLVHRDVSPQNVLIGRDGVARVIDFGVAKATGSARVTREGQIKGKIAYMAPEQIRAEPLDRRADIYAASVVLWEALTGRRLIAADNDAAMVLFALRNRIEPPSVHRPEVSPELDRILLRGLAGAPSDRFETAREMAQALEGVLTPAPAREVGLWVEELAGPEMNARAARIGRMEAESQITELPDAASAPESRLVEGARHDGPSDAATDGDVVRTELSSISMTTGRAPPSPTRSPRGAAALGVAALLAAAVGGFYAARLRDTPHDVTSAVSTAPAEGSAPTPPSAAPAPTASQATQNDAAASASALAAPSSVAPAASAAPAIGKVRPRSGHPGARPIPAACNPPFTITADGVRAYKPSCLR